ncbi:MAG: amidase [Hyphomonadaceae bacterium]|nr:amidase [Hyphomonadaceae bacterium]
MSAEPQSIAALRKAFAQGASTPLSALEACRARAEARNAALNAIVHPLWAEAEAAARASTQRWRDRKPLSLIDGAPIAVKANVAVEGAPWTAAMAPFAQRMAQSDAACVARLRAAGVVVIGVANMHEAAFGATTTSPLYGACMHPLRDGYTPGGSSGGSAAATAAGFCAGAIGTDTMGSVRLPSAYCGIVGMKPSFGRVSRAGVELLSWSLDHVGVHAATPADARLLLDAIQGYDARDPFSLAFDIDEGELDLHGVRIGAPALDVAVEPDIAAAFDRAKTRFAALGAELVAVDWDVSFAAVRRAALLVTEAEGAVALAAVRDDGGLSSGLRALLAYGATMPAEKLARAYFDIAHTRAALRRAFDAIDAVILPTTPHVAFPHDQPAPAAQADLTALANVAGLPAISVPMGADAQGLPCGLQIVAPFGEDAFCLALAEAFDSPS